MSCKVCTWKENDILIWVYKSIPINPASALSQLRFSCIWKKRRRTYNRCMCMCRCDWSPILTKLQIAGSPSKSQVTLCTTNNSSINIHLSIYLIRVKVKLSSQKLQENVKIIICIQCNYYISSAVIYCTLVLLWSITCLDWSCRTSHQIMSRKLCCCALNMTGNLYMERNQTSHCTLFIWHW